MGPVCWGTGGGNGDKAEAVAGLLLKVLLWPLGLSSPSLSGKLGTLILAFALGPYRGVLLTFLEVEPLHKHSVYVHGSHNRIETDCAACEGQCMSLGDVQGLYL